MPTTTIKKIKETLEQVIILLDQDIANYENILEHGFNSDIKSIAEQHFPCEYKSISIRDIQKQLDTKRSYIEANMAYQLRSAYTLLNTAQDKKHQLDNIIEEIYQRYETILDDEQQARIDDVNRLYQEAELDVVSPTVAIDDSADEDELIENPRLVVLKTALETYVTTRNQGSDYNNLVDSWIGSVSTMFTYAYSKTQKTDAATALLDIINGDREVELNPTEVAILNEGRLGSIVTEHGGLDTILSLPHQVSTMYSHN